MGRSASILGTVNDGDGQSVGSVHGFSKWVGVACIRNMNPGSTRWEHEATSLLSCLQVIWCGP